MMGYPGKLIETITTSILYLKFKVNNENDMAAHAICFYFCFCRQASQIKQNSCRASADTLPLDGPIGNKAGFVLPNNFWTNFSILVHSARGGG